MVNILQHRVKQKQTTLYRRIAQATPTGKFTTYAQKEAFDKRFKRWGTAVAGATALEKLMLLSTMKISIHFSLIIAFSLILQIAFGQNLLLFNGETASVSTCSYHYGGYDSLNVHSGNYAFRGNPDPWHSPGITLKCQNAWRKNISTYNELSFYIKASELGHSAKVSFYGWPKVSKGVDILNYIQGGILDTIYRKVTIPLDSFKTSTFQLESIEILYFGTSVNGSNYSIFIDDIWAVDTEPNTVDSVTIVANQVLKVEIEHRYDTTQVQNLSLYSLSSPTDSDFLTPQNPQKIGLHYFVKSFEKSVLSIPIFQQELFLVFNQKMKNGQVYTLTIDNIQDLSQNDFPTPFQYTFTYNDLDKITGTVKANQVGYQTDGLKYAYIGNYLGGAGYLDINSSDVPTFEIRAATTDAVVFSGVPTFRGLDKRLSGEKVFECDFSAFQTAGNYYVYVPNMGRSYDFEIANTIYDDVYKTVMRAFYFQRHSESLNTPFVPADYARGGCPTTAKIDISHTTSPLYHAATDYPVGTVLQMSGGWFDAGDYGRYVPTASVALDYLFTAFEMYPQKFGDNDLNIPESGNGIPDILDEAKIELDWLLQMQAPDGGVYFKVTTTAYANSMPSLNTDTRYIAEKTTFSTALFAATMAQAYRQYQPYLPVFADTCLARSKKAWAFLQQHLAPIPTKGYVNQGNLGGGTYSDPLGDIDDRAWAAAELYKSTGDTSYHNAFKYYWLQNQPNWGWNYFQHHQTKASWAYCTTTNFPIDSTYYWGYVKLVKIGLDNYDKVRADQNIYRCSYRSDVIPWIGWGSFAQSSSYSWGFIKGYYLLGKPEYLDYARLNFDVQLGANPQSKTYITGIGDNAPQDPTHHPSYQDNVAAPIPGLPVHGPHSHIPMSNSFYSDAQKKENLYPFGQNDYDPYPTLRRYYDVFQLVQMSEFTIDHIAKTAVSFAFFNTNNFNTPLPVELIFFNAICKNKQVELSWQTASEQNNEGFNIQRSTDAKNWETIGFVAGKGTTLEVQDYTYTDKAPVAGINYYRLKQLDFDGKFEYSKIVSVTCKGIAAAVSIYPNPVKDVLTIQNAQETTAVIYNALGQLVQQFAVQNALFNISLNELPTGVYIVQFQQSNGATITKQFVK